MADKIIETLLTQVDAEVLIAELRRRLLGLPPGTESGGLESTVASPTGGRGDGITQGVIRPDEFFRLSNPEAIRKYLAIMKRPQTPRAIVEGLKAGGVLSNAKNFYANIWTELKRASDRGEIVNTTAGWGLSEWYPSKPKLADNGKKPSRAKRRGRGAKAKKGAVAKSTSTAAKPQLKAAQGAAPEPKSYQQFVSEGAKAGKNLKQIAEEWRARKAAK